MRFALQSIRENKPYAKIVEENQLKREMFMLRHVPGYSETPKKHVEIIVERVDEDGDIKLDW
jgi:hypothetical protein